MSIGLIGRKVGMTQVFQADGTMVAVSVVAIQPNTVTRLRTVAQDGYTAVQIGTDVVAKLTKPEAGQLGSLPKVATIREFRVDDIDEYSVGQTLSIDDLFSAGDLVDVTSAVPRPTGRTITAPRARSGRARPRVVSTRGCGWLVTWVTSG